MEFALLIFIISFLITFCMFFFCLHRKYIRKDNLYIIIPIISFSLWAFLCFYYLNTVWYKQNEELWSPDFQVFYSGGQQILKNPADLYKVPRYLYLPSFAIFFAVTFSLLPFQISFYSFYIFNYLTGVFAILEFNRILNLMDVKKKAHRFIFLIVISNGYSIWVIFFLNHFKFLIFLILLFIIRREIYVRKEGNNKSRAYYILNYGLFIFILGMAPYFIFLLLIYFFKDIQLKDKFKREKVEISLIVILWFIIQNFTFILFPSQIFDVLNGLNRPAEEVRGAYPLYLKDIIDLTSSQMEIVNYIYIGILAICTLILILIKKLNIEQKFSLFLLTYLFFGIISYPPLIAYNCFSFILFLFVPFLKQNLKGKEFVYKNLVFLIGITSIFLINNDLNFLSFTFFNIILYDFGTFGIFRLFVLHMIMLICLFVLYIKKDYIKENKMKKLNKN